MSRTKLKVAAVAATLAAALAGGLGLIPAPDRTQAASAPRAGKPAHPLAGTWAAARIETRHPDRKEDPLTFDGDRDTRTFVFERGACKTVQHTRGDDGTVRKVGECDVTLDDTTDPRRLTLHVTKDGDHWKIRMIYEVNGDTLRLCFYSLGEEGGKEVVAWPDGFDLDQQHVQKYPRLDTFKRVGPKGKEGGATAPK